MSAASACRASPAVDSRAAAGVLRASTAVGLEQAVVAAAAAAAASGPAHGPAVALPAAAAQGVCGHHLDRSVLIHFSGDKANGGWIHVLCDTACTPHIVLG